VQALLRPSFSICHVVPSFVAAFDPRHPGDHENYKPDEIYQLNVAVTNGLRKARRVLRRRVVSNDTGWPSGLEEHLGGGQGGDVVVDAGETGAHGVDREVARPVGAPTLGLLPEPVEVAVTELELALHADPLRVSTGLAGRLVDLGEGRLELRAGAIRGNQPSASRPARRSPARVVAPVPNQIGIGRCTGIGARPAPVTVSNRP
jgi:hypothetical protein